MGFSLFIVDTVVLVKMLSDFTPRLCPFFGDVCRVLDPNRGEDAVEKVLLGIVAALVT